MKKFITVLLIAATALCAASCDKETITAAPSDDMTYEGYISSEDSIKGKFSSVEASFCSTTINHEEDYQSMTIELLPFYYKSGMNAYDKISLTIRNIPSTGEVGEYRQDDPSNSALGFEIESIWVQQNGHYIEFDIYTDDGFKVRYEGWSN